MIYIDPSITCTGWARFLPGVGLVQAGVLRPRGEGWLRLVELGRAAPAVEPGEGVVVEWPHLRGRGAARSGKPDDLFKLAAATGALIAGCRPRYGGTVHSLLPHEWKGQIPKEVTQRHMWGVLREAEKRVLASVTCPKHLKHNMFDAVCIGLFWEGRAPWKSRNLT